MDQVLNFAAYNIYAEGEISYLLSHFNSEYIFDVINDNIEYNRTKFETGSNPNVVASFEENFKYLIKRFPSDKGNIDNVRIETYREIINLLCNRFNPQFNDTGDIEYYSAAYYLYDFLVANFNNYIVLFYSNFIFNEKNTIYDAMNLDVFKKNKDSSTLYGKKMYNDTKLAVINANLELIINNLKTFDFSFDDILSSIYIYDRTIPQFLSGLVAPYDDFYKNIYCTTISNPDQMPIFLTGIRLAIQRNYMIDNTINEQMGGNTNV